MLSTIKKISQKTNFWIALVICLLFYSPIINAQPNNQLTISPAFISTELSDSNNIQKTQIQITNSYSKDIILEAELYGIDETDGKLAPNGDIDPLLKDSIILSTNEITIGANSSAILEVTIVNKPQLPPGGHYASLVLKQKPTNGQNSLLQEMSLAIFIVKNGGEKTDLILENYNIKHNIFKLPSSARLSFKNTGNIHSTPRAIVLLKTTNDKIIAKSIINKQSLPLLPSKSITLDAPVDKLSTLWLPHKIKLEINYRSDDSPKAKILTDSFYYIPPLFILLVTLSLVAALAIFALLIKIVRKKRTKNKFVAPHPTKNQASKVTKINIKDDN